jgi:hypothetical protein
METIATIIQPTNPKRRGGGPDRSIDSNLPFMNTLPVSTIGTTIQTIASSYVVDPSSEAWDTLMHKCKSVASCAGAWLIAYLA